MNLDTSSEKNDVARAGAASIKQQQGNARFLLTVTPAHKSVAVKQFRMQHFATWSTVGGLLMLQLSDPFLSWRMTAIWAFGAVLSWAIRMLMFRPLRKLPPDELLKNPKLMLLPLLSSVLASAFWIWTITLFTGPVLSMREVVLCMGFLCISLAMTGMFVVTPSTSLVYYVVLWFSFSFSLWYHGTASIPALIAINAIVMVIIWVNVFSSITQLRDQVEQNKQNEELKDIAYNKLEVKSAFFTESSHDFQQRLYALKLWLSSIVDSKVAMAEVAVPVNRLGQDINSLQAYVQNILDYARIESMDAGVNLETISLQALFQKLDVHFEAEAADAGRTLRVCWTDLWLNTDLSLLQRMLENLISNALKYTRKGVLVCARRRKDHVAIEVWDQGPGIHPDARERIFEAFQRENEDPSSLQRRGAGLGLAIVRRFGDRLKYEVKLSSTLGRGSCFRVLIPVSAVVRVERRRESPSDDK